MVRSLAKHSGFFKKKDKNTIPETDMQENVAQMMEGPMDQDPVQEDADIADTDMNDIGVQETAVDAGNAVDEADIADDDTETSEDLDDTDRNSQAAEEYEETGNIIDCDSLVKIYKTDEVEVMALQGLELTIKKGELMAVIGKSGSGKSTLLNMIGGLERPTAGKLYVDGKDLFAMTDKELVEYRKHTVGFVWQKNSRNLLPYMTALENVQVPMYFDKDNKEDREARAYDLLCKVGLKEKVNSYPAQMSGGEQQRVALARALVNKPEILLADEPTGNLDPKNSWEIMRLLEDVNKKGTTVVVVTHNKEIVNMMKKRVITLKHGEIISDEQKGGYIDED